MKNNHRGKHISGFTFITYRVGEFTIIGTECHWFPDNLKFSLRDEV